MLLLFLFFWKRVMPRENQQHFPASALVRSSDVPTSLQHTLQSLSSIAEEVCGHWTRITLASSSLIWLHGSHPCIAPTILISYHSYSCVFVPSSRDAFHPKYWTLVACQLIPITFVSGLTNSVMITAEKLDGKTLFCRLQQFKFGFWVKALC